MHGYRSRCSGATATGILACLESGAFRRECGQARRGGQRARMRIGMPSPPRSSRPQSRTSMGSEYPNRVAETSSRESARVRTRACSAWSTSSSESHSDPLRSPLPTSPVDNLRQCHHFASACAFHDGISFDGHRRTTTRRGSPNSSTKSARSYCRKGISPVRSSSAYADGNLQGRNRFVGATFRGKSKPLRGPRSRARTKPSRWTCFGCSMVWTGLPHRPSSTSEITASTPFSITERSGPSVTSGRRDTRWSSGCLTSPIRVSLHHAAT